MKTSEVIDKIINSIRIDLRDIDSGLKEMEILAQEELNDEVTLLSMVSGGFYVQRLAIYINEVKRILQVRDNWKTDQVLSVMQDVLNIKNKSMANTKPRVDAAGVPVQGQKPCKNNKASQ